MKTLQIPPGVSLVARRRQRIRHKVLVDKVTKWLGAAIAITAVSLFGAYVLIGWLDEGLKALGFQ